MPYWQIKPSEEIVPFVEILEAAAGLGFTHQRLASEEQKLSKFLVSQA